MCFLLILGEGTTYEEMSTFHFFAELNLNQNLYFTVCTAVVENFQKLRIQLFILFGISTFRAKRVCVETKTPRGLADANATEFSKSRIKKSGNIVGRDKNF